MSNSNYVKEFLDAMYVKDFLDFSLEMFNGVTTRSHIYNDGEDEIELACITEAGAESFVVTGRQIAPDHGINSEVEIIATTDPDKALQAFEDAIEAITSQY